MARGASAKAIADSGMRGVPHEMDQGLGQGGSQVRAGQADAVGSLTAERALRSTMLYQLLSGALIFC